MLCSYTLDGVICDNEAVVAMLIDVMADSGVHKVAAPICAVHKELLVKKEANESQVG